MTDYSTMERAELDKLAREHGIKVRGKGRTREAIEADLQAKLGDVAVMDNPPIDASGTSDAQARRAQLLKELSELGGTSNGRTGRNYWALHVNEIKKLAQRHNFMGSKEEIIRQLQGLEAKEGITPMTFAESQQAATADPDITPRRKVQMTQTNVVGNHMRDRINIVDDAGNIYAATFRRGRTVGDVPTILDFEFHARMIVEAMNANL